MTRIGPYGMTKEEHDAAVAKRNGRPLTQDPIHVRNVDDRTNDDGMTPNDRIIAEALAHERKQGAALAAAFDVNMTTAYWMVKRCREMGHITDSKPFTSEPITRTSFDPQAARDAAAAAL